MYTFQEAPVTFGVLLIFFSNKRSRSVIVWFDAAIMPRCVLSARDFCRAMRAMAALESSAPLAQRTHRARRWQHPVRVFISVVIFSRRWVCTTAGRRDWRPFLAEPPPARPVLAARHIPSGEEKTGGEDAHFISAWPSSGSL